MKIEVKPEEIENLSWILSLFVDTHNDSSDIYPGEIKLANKILKLLNKNLCQKK